MTDNLLVPGIDVVEIAEVSESIRTFGDRYVRRIHRPAEAERVAGMAAARRDAYLAGRFAAKEAVFKALRMPAGVGMAWTCIEITREPDGAPGVRLHGTARHWAHLNGIEHVTVSITHDAGRAMAMAIAQRAPEGSPTPQTIPNRTTTRPQENAE